MAELPKDEPPVVSAFFILNGGTFFTRSCLSISAQFYIPFTPSILEIEEVLPSLVTFLQRSFDGIYN